MYIGWKKSDLHNKFNPLSPSIALIETSQLIYTANQLTGFYMRVTLALNGLIIWPLHFLFSSLFSCPF